MLHGTSGTFCPHFNCGDYTASRNQTFCALIVTRKVHTVEESDKNCTYHIHFYDETYTKVLILSVYGHNLFTYAPHIYVKDGRVHALTWRIF